MFFMLLHVWLVGLSAHRTVKQIWLVSLKLLLVFTESPEFLALIIRV